MVARGPEEGLPHFLTVEMVRSWDIHQYQRTMYLRKSALCARSLNYGWMVSYYAGFYAVNAVLNCEFVKIVVCSL